LSVNPWIASVPGTTEKVVSTIRSRYGNAAGSAIAAASETIPRMPAQEITNPLPTLGRSIGRGGLKPKRRCRHLTTALKGMCQTRRTTITVSRTAPTTAK
jgi:hypothetical protein